MEKVHRSRRASRDLEQIVSYIAADNLAAALRWIADMTKLFELFSKQPFLGQSIQTRRHGSLRRITRGNYVVYYRPVSGGIHVVRVYHGARDPDQLL